MFCLVKAGVRVPLAPPGKMRFQSPEFRAFDDNRDANDDSVRTMHTVAARTEGKRLPAAVAASLDRNHQRCAARAQAWRQHEAQTHARETAYQRITDTSHQRRDRERNRRAHRGYALEL
jgi:hypothetical protein